jgi:hypothetical protein
VIDFYVCEDKALEKELNVWVTFYMTFKDYSKENADLALHTNFSLEKLEESVESLRKANFQWVEDLKALGFSEKEIIDYMPCAEEYCIN